MRDFVGRRGYMVTLEAELDRVRQTGRDRFVSMRGRRKVGNSRLVDEFLRQGWLFCDRAVRIGPFRDLLSTCVARARVGRLAWVHTEPHP